MLDSRQPRTLHRGLVRPPPPATASLSVLSASAAPPATFDHIGSGPSMPGPRPPDGRPLNESFYSDSEYRTFLGTKRTRSQMDLDPPDALGASFSSSGLDSTRAGQRPKAWPTFSIETLGGFLDRAWKFCKSGASGSFHAVAAGHAGRRPSRCHRAGDVPPTGLSPSMPWAKRRQTGRAEDLARNWVLVGAPIDETHTPSPSLRLFRRNRNHGPTATTGRRIAASPLRSGSRSLARTSSSLSFTLPGCGRSRASILPAPTGSSSPEADHLDAAPRLDFEAKQLAARRRIEDREADARITAFNHRLQEMIFQGREALRATADMSQLHPPSSLRDRRRVPIYSPLPGPPCKLASASAIE